MAVSSRHTPASEVATVGFTFAAVFFCLHLSGRENRSKPDQSALVPSSRPVSSYPLLCSTSSAVIGCVLKRSPVLRPPEGRYRRARRRTPSGPGFTARSREHVVRPVSGQLAEEMRVRLKVITRVNRPNRGPVHVHVHFLGQGAARRLLQEGTSQLTHRHPGVELRSIESGGALPAQHAGRVLDTLPGGGAEDPDLNPPGSEQESYTKFLPISLAFPRCRERFYVVVEQVKSFTHEATRLHCHTHVHELHVQLQEIHFLHGRITCKQKSNLHPLARGE